jgi:ABC-2 type transport system permease protein
VGAVIGSTLFVYALESVALILLGRLLFGVPLPARVFSLVLTLLLGAVSFAALALALTGVIRTAEGSSAVVNAIYLPMTFISGSFFSSHSFPRFVRAIAEVLPLTHFIRLVRDVMLRGDEIWSRPGAVGVVAAWGAVGAILALRGFRWEPTEG